jgi:hypothetical protein
LPVPDGVRLSEFDRPAHRIRDVKVYTDVCEINWHREWNQDIVRNGMSVWPEWMQRLKDY